MCLTLPRTMITLAGIEKVCRGSRIRGDAAGGALATGERMNPYTSIWTGVTRDGRKSFTWCC